MGQILCPTLIGRQEETDVLRAALARAQAILSVLSGAPDAEELTPYRPFLGRLVPEWGMPAPVEQSLVWWGSPSCGCCGWSLAGGVIWRTTSGPSLFSAWRRRGSSAEGVPFLVEELMAACAGEGVLSRRESGWAVSGSIAAVVPLSFAEMVTRRITTLGEETRSVLQAAAVLGRRFDWSFAPGHHRLDPSRRSWTRSGRAWTRSSSRWSGTTEPSASGSAKH